MDSLAFASIKELREKLQKKELSTAELIDASLERIKKYDGRLNAFIERFDAATVAPQGSPDAPLYGIPGAVKDVICQKGRAATAVQKFLQVMWPLMMRLVLRV